MMKGFNVNLAVAFAPAKALPRPKRHWTCRRCLLQSQNLRQVRGFASRNSGYGQGQGQGKSKGKARGRVLMAAAGAGLGVSTLAFTDDIRHSYETVERTGRVVSTLAVSINE